MTIELEHQQERSDQSPPEVAYAEPSPPDVVLLSESVAATVGAVADLPQKQELPPSSSSSSSSGPAVAANATATADRACAPTKNREVIPMYGSNTKLPQNEIKRLLAVAGDHSLPEEEWVRACHLLGDYDHKPAVRRRRSYAPIILSLVLLAVGATTFNLLNSTKSIAPVAAPTEVVPLAPVAVAPAEVDFGPYMADLQRRIKRCWFPPRGNETKRVVVRFKVFPDGSMTNLKIWKSSGLAVADRAALDAVRNAVPFHRLPAGVDSDRDIEFTFDYNVFTGGHPDKGFDPANNSDSNSDSN